MDKNLALETLKSFVQNTDNVIAKDAILALHPELAKSEDERIRKEIYNFLIDMECKKEWIAYLEKQKEHPTSGSSEKPNIQWSEEDKKWFDYFERLLEFGYNKNPHDLGKLCLDGKMWLKSLRPQSHWKPSEEQIEAFGKVSPEMLLPHEREAFHSLYNDLKKL